MADLFTIERGEVKTEAQRERERIAQAAREAGTQVVAEAESQRQAVATEATRARERIEKESKDTQEAIRQGALESQAIVRKQQSVVEREAELAKAKAREAKRVEQRKADLPITRPRELGTAQFVAGVETARRKAHREGRNVRAAIEKERDRFFNEVDGATKEALVDIDRQKSGIEADIDKAVVKAEAEIAKQKAVLDTQVEEWRSDSLAAIDKAQTDYNTAVTKFEASHVKLGSGEYVAKEDWAKLDKDAQNYVMAYGIEKGTIKYNASLKDTRQPSQIFTDMKVSGGIPWSAIFESYNKETGEIKYSIPDRRLPSQIFKDMKASGDIPQEALFQSWNPQTREVTWKMPTKLDTRLPSQIFKDMIASGDIPRDAILESYNKETGEITYAMPDTRLPSVIFADLKEAGTIPKEALFQSWDTKTKEITWKMPTKPLPTVFVEMKASGDIPKDALLTGYDKETGEISYTLPTAKDDRDWFTRTVDYVKQALTVDEATLTGKIFGIPNPGLERAAAQVNKIFEVFAPQVETKLADDPKGFFAETGKVVASYMPFVWATNWRGMSTESKIINGAIDAIILVSFGLGSGLRHLKAKPIVKAATGAGRAADKMDDALRILAKTPIDDVAKYSRASSNAQKAIQASKVADNAFIAQLSKVKKLTSGQLKTLEKASGVRGLRQAIIDVSKAQTQLKNAWKPVTTLKLGGKRYIAQMTKVEAAQAQLAKTLASFNAKLKPRYTFSTSPEFKGFALEWRNKILPTYRGGQPVVAPLSSGKGVQLAVLEKVAPKVKLQNVYKAILKPVYKKGEMVARRVVPPTVKPVSKVATVAMTGVALARKIGVKPVVAKTITKEVAKAITKKEVAKTITTEAQRQAAKISTRATTRVTVERIIKEATKRAVDIMAVGKTAAQVRTMTELNIETMIKALPLSATKTELQTETVVRTLTKTAIKLATKIITTTKTALKVKIGVRIVPHIVLPDGTSRPMTEKELAGAVPWKQGFIYKMVYPPYGEGDIMHSRKPFPGVRTLKGAGSAYQTVIRLGGKVPSSIKRDMGIMDIEIKTPETGKPKLVFRADIKQETWHGGPRGKKRRFVNRKRTDRRQRRLQQTAAAI